MVEVKVRILGSDSMGARSMATVIYAGGLKILVDPGVSFAPRRYGLPPHELELKRVGEIKERIIEEASDSDLILITHYHYDHYLYKEEDLFIYEGKRLIVKHPTQMINASQRIRAYRLLKKGKVEEKAKSIDYLDGAMYEIDRGFKVIGSPPVPHGSDNTKLGYVVMVLIECCDLKFVHASDVQGPISEKAMKILESWKPDILFISGPPTYFKGLKAPDEDVDRGYSNLLRLAQLLGEDSVLIVDHHMARDVRYPQLLEDIARRVTARVMSAAEFMGVSIELLEARRKELWTGTNNSDRASGGASFKMDSSRV